MYQDTGLKRKVIDKFYTSLNVVEDCMKLVEEKIEIGPNDLCIEPCAGSGAFNERIKSLFENYLFYDIEPEHNEIIKIDFFDLNLEEIVGQGFEKIHAIGNPPFGRQSSLAIKFIKKCSKYCDSISFILPKSFKKESMRRYFPLNFHLISETDLPEYSFEINGEEYDVPCIFQIWLKKSNMRLKPIKLVPNNKYKFVKRDEEYDITFRRVGVYAGKIAHIVGNEAKQSHYFIKFNVELTQELFEELSNIEFASKDNTVGPKSISKQELIEEFNKILE